MKSKETPVVSGQGKTATLPVQEKFSVRLMRAFESRLAELRANPRPISTSLDDFEGTTIFDPDGPAEP
jgi:hypothetical protein